MARIYFDSNVFSNLRNRNQEKFIALSEAIAKYKDNLVFFFSHAHIRDKTNDTTNFKFEDFEYMKTLVGNNYLSYHALEKRTSYYLATPKEVFEDEDALLDVNFVMGGSYKQLRSLIESGGRDLPVPAGDKMYVQDELFKDGEIQDKFFDYIKDSLYHKDKNNIPYYDFYLHAYSVLDILGFSKDKLNKKNSYNNVFNDSLHSYYARYCDYLISDDDGLRKKSSLLYNKVEVKTKILSVDEFLQKIDEIGVSTDNNVTQFFSKLGRDLISGDLLSNSMEGDMRTYIIKPKSRYFNFFDSLMVLKSENNEFHIFLSKSDDHFLSQPNYKEQGMITNRVVGLFSEDLGGKKYFEWETEKKEIEDGKWSGRYWELGDTRIHLQINEGSRNFCIQIGPLTRWYFVSVFINGTTKQEQ